MSKIKFRLEILEGGYLLFQILEMDRLLRDNDYLYIATNGIKIKSYATPDLLMPDVDVDTIYIRGTCKEEDRFPIIKYVLNPLRQKNRILEAIKEWINSIENYEDEKDNSNIYEY